MMSSSNKTPCSSTSDHDDGGSVSQDQLRHQDQVQPPSYHLRHRLHQNVPLVEPHGILSDIGNIQPSTTTTTTTTTNILDHSTALKPSTLYAAAGHAPNSIPGYDDPTGPTTKGGGDGNLDAERYLNSTNVFRIGPDPNCRYDMCAEILGFESMAETMDGGELAVVESQLASVRISRRRMRKESKRSTVFPPLLSTLDGNGRPRFWYEKERNGGRLVMKMVRNDEPEILLSYERDGLRIELANCHYKEEEEEEEEDEDTDTIDEEDRESELICSD